MVQGFFSNNGAILDEGKLNACLLQFGTIGNRFAASTSLQNVAYFATDEDSLSIINSSGQWEYLIHPDTQTSERTLRKIGTGSTDAAAGDHGHTMTLGTPTFSFDIGADNFSANLFNDGDTNAAVSRTASETSLFVVSHASIVDTDGSHDYETVIDGVSTINETGSGDDWHMQTSSREVASGSRSAYATVTNLGATAAMSFVSGALVTI